MSILYFKLKKLKKVTLGCYLQFLKDKSLNLSYAREVIECNLKTYKTVKGATKKGTCDYLIDRPNAM